MQSMGIWMRGSCYWEKMKSLLVELCDKHNVKCTFCTTNSVLWHLWFFHVFHIFHIYFTAVVLWLLLLLHLHKIVKSANTCSKQLGLCAQWHNIVYTCTVYDVVCIHSLAHSVFRLNSHCEFAFETDGS